MASTPDVTAVGGTDLQWPFNSNAYTTYWNTTSNSHGATAKGYMPEMSWNDTCTNRLLLNIYPYPDVESLCNAAISGDPGLVEMGAGSGGVSNCTTPKGSTISSCAGGYAKPTWQTGGTAARDSSGYDLRTIMPAGAADSPSLETRSAQAQHLCRPIRSLERSSPQAHSRSPRS